MILNFLFVPFSLQVGWSEIALESNHFLKKVNFWVFSVVTKLGPCFLLTYLSLALISTLVEVDKRKARLHNRGVFRDDSTLSRSQSVTERNMRIGDMTKRSSISKYYAERTNRMLVAVLLLFLVTEFPSGILVLLSGIFGDHFFQEVYSPLGEILDILALINSSVNFILYCTMSGAFRKTFKSLFCAFNITTLHINRGQRPYAIEVTARQRSSSIRTATFV